MSTTPLTYKIINLCLLVVFSFAGLTRAGWYHLFEPQDTIQINDALILADGTLVAAGNNGSFYRISRGQDDWQAIRTGSESHLRALAGGYNGEQDILISAGRNGLVARSTDQGRNWTIGQVPDRTHFKTVAFDASSGRFWMAGEDPSVYYSLDFGLSWQALRLPEPGVVIEDLFTVELETGESLVYVVASRQDSSFTFHIDRQLSLYRGESVGDTYLLSGTYIKPRIFLTGFTAGGEAALFTQYLIDDRPGPIQSRPIALRSRPVNIAGIREPRTSQNIVVIAGENGSIYESRDNGLSWIQTYEDSWSVTVPVIVAAGETALLGETGSAFAVTGNGMILLNGFELEGGYPYINELAPPYLQEIRLTFTQIPELESVREGVFLKSSYSGFIPCLSDYDVADSTSVMLTINRKQDVGGIPGEIWNVSLDAVIQEAAVAANPLTPLNYDATFLPLPNPDFNFEKLIPSSPWGFSGSNFVAGWINNDMNMDLITYGDDRLLIYTVTGTGDIEYRKSEGFPISIEIQPDIRNQLLTEDVDLDGDPDLLLYDDQEIYLILNRSTDLYTFEISEVPLSGNGIRQVLRYNANNNALADILVLSDSLYTILDITNSLTGLVRVDYTQPGGFQDVSKIEIGDLNADGIQDLVMISPTAVRVLNGDGAGGFTEATQFTHANAYTDIRLADLDRDHYPEIIALSSAGFDVLHLNHADFISLLPSSVSHLLPNDTGAITAFTVQDFGQRNGEYGDGLPDIIAVTENNGIKIFENVSFSTLQFGFVEQTIKNFNLDQYADDLMAIDLNNDGKLDILANDRTTSRHQVVLKKSWAPEIREARVQSDGIFLSWHAFNDALGAFESYRIFRTEAAAGMVKPVVFDVFNRDDTTFVDTSVEKFRSYSYEIQAFYDGAIETDRSRPVRVETYILLTNPVTGILSDTTYGYIVKEPLSVPVDGSLLITQGIEILFDVNAAFDIRGRFEVKGTDKQIVNIYGSRETNEQNWTGIRVHPGQDTVRMEWFSVSNAQTGIMLDGRPLKIHYGGFALNKTGLDVTDAAVFIENVSIDSNEVGVILNSGAQAFVKNTDLFHTRTAGFLVNADARLDLKNSILWFNEGPAIQALDQSNVNAAYSTVQSWSGPVNALELSRLAPVFMPPDSGYYRPAFMSPTVDAGDPADDFSAEPMPNGGRINQGLYGGTWLATPTFQPRILIEPQVLEMAAKPARTDTMNMAFRNQGNVDLEVQSFAFGGISGIFRLESGNPFTVLPGGQVGINLLFTPEKRIVYGDTLRVYSNDPHKPVSQVVLSGTGLNSPPEMAGTLPDTAWVGRKFEFDLPIVDDDMDTLSFSAVEIPSWLTLSPAGILSGIPAIGDTASVHHLEIRIDDGHDGILTLSHDITVAFINQAPVWQGPLYLQYTEDIPPLPYDLTGMVQDENTVFENIEFDVSYIQDTVGLAAWISDHHLLNILPAADYFNEEPVLVVLSAKDIKGLISFEYVYVRVEGVEDAPRFVPVPDTIIYTSVLFNIMVNAWEVDGQTLSYSDNSELFDIHPDSGYIRFTPTVQDTGLESVVLTFDDGNLAVMDTFHLTIRLNPVQSPYNLALEGMDQKIAVSFMIPQSESYTGTRIYYSENEPVLAPNQGVMACDTVPGNWPTSEPVRIIIGNLKIGQTYFISVFNYLEQGNLIFSPPLTGEGFTLAPDLVMDTSARTYPLPVNRRAGPTLQVRNEGGGTLLFHFSYEADSLTGIWFSADTSRHSVPPGDSVDVAMELHPNRTMERRDYETWLKIQSNDPDNGKDSVRIILSPVFDDFPPRIVIVSRPDSLVRESAIMVEFFADDTTGQPIGDSEENLYKRFRCVNLGTSRTVAEGDSLKSNRITVYPLDDGDYRLELSAFDSEGNGLEGLNGESITFTILASRLTLSGDRWYMLAIPRPITYKWQDFAADSILRLYRWNNKENRYLPALNDPSQENSMGTAYWVFPVRQFDFNVRNYPQAAAEDSMFTPVEVGWNQVGVPVAYKSFWHDMMFRETGAGSAIPLEQAVAEQRIEGAVYWYRHARGLQGYEWAMIDTVTATPWRGYWLKSNREGTLIFSREPAFRPVLTSQNPDSTGSVSRISVDWELEITLQNDRYVDVKNIFGMTRSDHVHPVFEPPHFMDYCSFFFEGDQGALTRSLKKPFQDPDEVCAWNVTVETRSVQRDHVLTWSAEAIENAMIFLYMVDQQQEQIINMARQSTYTFIPGKTLYYFTIYATQDASFNPTIVPIDFRLSQNYPNPFNPRTVIRFGVPEFAGGQRITLKVFNVLGQEIATLVDQNLEMGYHESEWTGINKSGQPVSSGVYFYKLATGKDVLVRKMILIR